ncbi:hypothetical protein [Salmonella phage SD-15_S21]|nr:hypothetical protein [Salmonella phage SD-15_S21]
MNRKYRETMKFARECLELIYTEKELKMLYIMSYFKKYCKFNTLSFEISAMKVFIKNVKELKRAFNVHRK